MINTKAPFRASILATAILLTACGGDSKSSNNFSNEDQAGFTSQTAGTSVISALGGDSASKQGGQGGSVNISQTNSPAALKVLTSGTPDTSYQLPTTSVQLGSLAVTISEDTEVEVFTNNISSRTEEGTLYFVEGKNRLYRYDGESDLGARENEVTGLIINEDVTVTLEGNSGDNIVLYFSNDIVNNGIIETHVSNSARNSAATRASISLFPSAYSGRGRIETQGIHPEQSGGDISISATSIINSGDFSAQGADGEDNDIGGQGGSIVLSTANFVENKGELNTSGGDSEEGTSGSAGSVTIDAGEIYNSGKILAEAGEGQNDSKQSASQSISLSADEILINAGDLSVNGSDSFEEGFATDAGKITLSLHSSSATRSNNRRLINNADLSANGGNTETTQSDQIAGQGGDITISATEVESNGAIDSTESLVIIAGNLLANGGDSSQEFVEDEEDNSITRGSNAGDAGNIVIEHSSSLSHSLPTYLSGYTNIQVDGGEGLQAGDAGSVSITNSSTDGELNSLAGPITVESNITADAGFSLDLETDETPSAGDGGNISIQVLNDQAYLQAGALTINLTGNASANASDVENGITAEAKSIYLSAPHGITAVANLSANGSSDLEGVDEDNLYNIGKDAGSIGLYSYEGSINYSGSVTANGGDGLEKGGNAGSFSSISSTSNLVAGSISLNGGNAHFDEEIEVGTSDETHGGDAGIAYINSDDYSATLSASVTTLAGSGDDAGRAGGAFVNADCQVGTCNDRDADMYY